MRATIFSLLLLSYSGALLQANPSMPTIVSGAAIFNESGNELFIGTSSNRTIIEWDSFSIQQGEITDILQPAATSAILNRVTSANPSDISGFLRSNGQVFLVNPNGILVGQGGRIDVGALVASTLDVMNTEFLAGSDMTFSGDSTATVQNSGLIRVDEGAYLLGRHIIQAGAILGVSARVDLGAGSSILLRTNNAGIMINAEVATPTGTGIESSGGILCNRSALRADGNLYALAIRHTGSISVVSPTVIDGEIILEAAAGETRIEDQGTLVAHGPNGAGGTVHVLGQTVNLLDQASVATENILGGGEIFIGGGGSIDPLILEAANTTVASGAELQASAKIAGDGGNVVVYGTNSATMAGTILARGGLTSGDGGFVEISLMPNITGSLIDTQAPNGATGTLLLDPTDITISNALNAGGSFDMSSPTDTFSGSAAAANLNIAALNTALLSNNVVITTSSVFGGTGNITVTATANLTLAGHNLTLLADNDITLTSSLNPGSIGSASVVTLNATNDVVMTSSFTGTSLNTVNILAGRDVVLDDVISAAGATINITAGRDIRNLAGGDNTITTENCNLTASNNITLINELNSTGEGSGSTVRWSAGNAITVSNDCDFTGWGLVSLEAVNNITNTDVLNMISVDQFEMTTTVGDIDINAGVNLAEADTTVSSANDINVTNLFISATTGNISMTSVQDINIGPSTTLAQVGSALGDVSLTTGRDLNVTGGATTNDRSQVGFDAVTVDSDISLTVGRNLNVVAGSNSNNAAIIGHGFTTSGTHTGDIIINSVGGNATLQADIGGVSTVKFAQIGHVRNTSSGTSTISGDIRGSTVGSAANILGNLTLTGGDDATSYALFGHGGRDSNAADTYSGEIRVQANSITLTGGTNADCFAAIGFFGVAQAGIGTNAIVVTPPATVQAITNTLTMTAQTNGIVSIGARALVDDTHPAMLDLDLVDVQTAGNLVMTSGSGTETEAVIGAFAEIIGANTASTAITMNVGGNLLINAGTGAPSQIINGSTTTDLKDITITVGGNITPTVAGAFGAFIRGTTGNTTVTAGGTISMIDPLTFIENAGGSNGFLSVTGGLIHLADGGFFRNLGTGTTSFATTVGSATLLSSGFIGSIGSVRGNVATDLILLQDASITSTAGSMALVISRDLNITGTSTGSSFISSFGIGSYHVGRDIQLQGVSSVNEGYIENIAGGLTVVAGVDITLLDYGRIENLGSGNLTLVVDNLFPTPPGIGPGAFELSSLATVGRLNGGPLRIFTARREQNQVLGTMNLNGTTFVPGPLFVDSATEEWNTYYPGGFSGVPFTIFYKNGPTPTTTDILAADPNAFVPFSELFYILEGYPMDPVWAWCYQVCVDDCCLCIDAKYCDEETLRAGYDIIWCRSLPPYMRKLDLRQYP